MPVAAPMPEPETVDWLLVLGSNADAERRLDAARHALADLGDMLEFSRVLAGADIAGGGRGYLNQLVALRCTLDPAGLGAALKRIEAEQGRSPERMAAGLCDLDLDLLARLDQGGRPHWLADKPLRIPAVRELLAERFGAAILG